jgi:hypothetical protein
MGSGVLAGFPVVDVKAELIDGAFHDVDSSALAFEIASRAAFREALQKGGSVLLEPIMKVEVVTPEEYTGSVIGDLNSRRGQIQGQDMRGNAVVINAMVPLANMFGYVNPALLLAGPRQFHDAVRPLRAGARERSRQGAGQVRLIVNSNNEFEGAWLWARKNSNGRSRIATSGRLVTLTMARRL